MDLGFLQKNVTSEKVREDIETRMASQDMRLYPDFLRTYKKT